MNHLLVFAEDDSRFDQREILGLLQKIGCGSIRHGTFIGAVADCEYHYDQESTIIRLSDDLKTISMSNTGGAALRAALLIQAELERPLRAVDTSYSFDVSLTALDSLHSFEEEIARQCE